MTVRQLMESLDSYELSQWAMFYALEAEEIAKLRNRDAVQTLVPKTPEEEQAMLERLLNG